MKYNSNIIFRNAIDVEELIKYPIGTICHCDSTGDFVKVSEKEWKEIASTGSIEYDKLVEALNGWKMAKLMNSAEPYMRNKDSFDGNPDFSQSEIVIGDKTYRRKNENGVTYFENINDTKDKFVLTGIDVDLNNDVETGSGDGTETKYYDDDIKDLISSEDIDNAIELSNI